MALRERFGIAAGARVPLRALLAHARMQAPDLGREADVVWLHLTWACHQRPEEVDPDLATVSSLVEDVRKIIG